MKRIIVDYKKLNGKILSLLTESFPDGYDYDDIISFRNFNNELIEAVEVRTDDTVYLVKVGKRLETAMEEFIEEENDNLDDDSNDDFDINDDTLEDIENLEED